MNRLLLSFLLFVSVFCSAQNNDQGVFLVNPYLQIGDSPSPQSMHLLWQVRETNDVWFAEYRNSSNDIWKKAETQNRKKVAVGNIPPFSVYCASFTGLKGKYFYYRISKNGIVVFNGKGKSLRSKEEPYKIVITGDIASGTKASRKIANGMYSSNPDMVLIGGDIVYNQGLISEYKTKFWPVYNAEKADTNGVPLMQSIPMVAAVGNHDADTRDLDRFPDALAYYHFWDQPLNGPDGIEGGAFVPVMKASEKNRQAFLTGAGEKYPRMTNYSFDYGNAHWTVLDSDTYVEWSDSALQAWVIKDLEAAQNATWRFVLFHHPGFNSSRAHYEQQQMRLISPILEKGNVDIVFAGHVHNYQRSYPLFFKPDNAGLQLVGSNNYKRGKMVNGRWTLDKKFDGKKNTKPDGIIYVVTGAGGQFLYNPEQTNDKDSWQPFTKKFESLVNSFTMMDVKDRVIILRQIDIDGNEIDRLKITK